MSGLRWVFRLGCEGLTGCVVDLSSYWHFLRCRHFAGACEVSGLRWIFRLGCHRYGWVVCSVMLVALHFFAAFNALVCTPLSLFHLLNLSLLINFSTASVVRPELFLHLNWILNYSCSMMKIYFAWLAYGFDVVS